MIATSSIHDAGSAERPRVLPAEDHPAMLPLKAAALADECLFVALECNGQALLAEAERLYPDVIMRLVCLSIHEDADFAPGSLDADALGYVIKARLLLASSRPSTKPLGEHRSVGAKISRKKTPKPKCFTVASRKQSKQMLWKQKC